MTKKEIRNVVDNCFKDDYFAIFLSQKTKEQLFYKSVMGIDNWSGSVTKEQLQMAVKAFSDATSKLVPAASPTAGEPEVIQVEINLPAGLRTRAFQSENSVNLLQVATVIYNNELTDKPELGFGKAIIFLGNEKMEYDFRIHSVSFNPTIDLEDTQLFAEMSSTDNSMLKRLINDKVLSFYVSGKLTQNEKKEVETIVINKIIAHTDQTAYAKRFAKVKNQYKVLDGYSNEIIKEEIFNDPSLGGIKMTGVLEAWKEYQKSIKKIGDNGPAPVNRPDPPLAPPKIVSMFDKWKKALKGKMVDIKD